VVPDAARLAVRARSPTVGEVVPLPAAWAAGAAAVGLVAILAGIAVATGVSRASLAHAYPPDGPLPEQGWEVTVSPDYRDTDFIVTWQSDAEQPHVRLIEPSTGLIAATIRVMYSPDVLIRPDQRHLLVTYLHGPEWEPRLLTLDLSNRLSFVRETSLPGRGGINRSWTTMTVSHDGRYLYNPRHAWQPGEDGRGHLDIIDLDTGDIVTRHTGEWDCFYGPLEPRTGGTVLARGFRFCRWEVAHLDAEGRLIQQWLIHEGDFDAADGIPFMTSEGRVGKIRRLGELDLIDPSGTQVHLGRLWKDGRVFEWNYATLRDGQIVMHLTHFEEEPVQSRLLVFNPETLAIEHSVTIPFIHFQPRPDGQGAWVIRADGALHSVDWDGTTRRVPAPPQPGLILAPRQ
jgi:hypothetical protein